MKPPKIRSYPIKAKHTKKRLPIPLTEEQWTSIDYVIIKPMDEEPTAVSEQQEPLDFPSFQVNFETIKVIKEPHLPHQIQQHLRFTDKRTGKTYDVDSYRNTREIRKYLKLEEEMKLKNIPYRSISTKPLRTYKLKIGTEKRTCTPLTISYYYEGELIRTATIKLETK